MTHATATATAPIVKTDWDSLPLGENLSHLCGGRNKHKTASEVEATAPTGDGWNIPTASAILSDPTLG
jgi:hypothetical protein